ncbi:MAG: ribosome small subunit-dependent GTPase A [Candidatus Riflebacteria bacterium]|nr:ribosome small subunit-dependent GTPase A [Candidatus Riflebacteria bacterium]
MSFTLENFGYSSFQELFRTENRIARESVARVVSDSRERYLLQTSAGACPATITGKLRFAAKSRLDLPAVGDWVSISRPDHLSAVIESLFPRRTNLERSAVGKTDVQIIAANVDTAFVVMAADGDFSVNRVDRYLALILNSGIIPVVVLNKCDLTTEETWKHLEKQIFKRHPAVEVIATSLISQQGLNILKECIRPAQTFCFVGSSGVGKSSLVNHFAGEQLLKTSQLSAADNLGQHTTTSRQLHLLPGGALLLDTPGMREVAMSDVEAGVEAAFSEIEEFAANCRFKNCRHENEPGCAISKAVTEGTLDEATLASYKKLLRESARFEQKIAEKRKNDKNFGKMTREVLKLKKLLKGT